MIPVIREMWVISSREYTDSVLTGILGVGGVLFGEVSASSGDKLLWLRLTLMYELIL